MKLGLLSILVCFLSTPIAFAEGGASSNADKHTSVLRLLDLTGAVQMGQQIINQLLALHRNSHPGVPSTVWGEIRTELDVQDFKPALAKVYDHHFSADEIEALVAFYESDVGRKLIEKQPKILEDSIAAGQIWAGDVQTKLVDMLERKGYVATE